ncbi:putative GPI anchored protein [Aspergillus lucknowensis]|uniref:GPI anchored protein n=1 Tax=Aspergillus lucknowensis TaxID=176173 RepID=A0ABR4M6A8_9EURO
MIFAPVLIGVASIAAQVSADINPERAAQRNAAIQALLSQQSVQGVQKMSDDEGEKFFMDYWHFGEDSFVANSTVSPDNSQNTQFDRNTVLPRSYPLSRPFSLGVERFSGIRLSPLIRRDFQCPAGTHACTSIDRSDSCCGTDETCVVVEDTGSGDVGCCPAGRDCSGTIGSCWEGYTSCPSSLGGGCCIPGYDCVSGGCARVVTITITTHSTTLTTTSIETIPTTTTTTTTTSSSTTSSSTTDLAPPDRPTSLSTTTTTSRTESVCPTGFYACSAVYHGGCCRTGRDCDTTSCPAIPSTTIVSDDRTIVVPEATTTSRSGEGSGPRGCASGWFKCADTVGGGCCPSGYACGESCTAVPTASTTGTVAKEEPAAPPNDGNRATRSWKTLIYMAFGTIWTML